MWGRFALFCVALVAVTLAVSPALRHRALDLVQPARDLEEIRVRVTPGLRAVFAAQGLALGAPAYLRVFKETETLEVWIAKGDTYALFRSYAICNHSVDLGPKLAEGDRQSPEGFYKVGLEALNPNSSYHLSFNLGFPNAYDRGQGQTGSFLMILGDCVSVGCYAMTDVGIEEIYLIVEAALRGGQEAVPVHAFPFPMTPARMAQAKGHRWYGFWSDLQPAYAAFEATQQVPDIVVEAGRYAVR